MTISELNHINIRTMLMEETKDFYVDILGLEVGHRPPFDSHGYWLYCGDVAIVHLSLSMPECDRRTVAEAHGNGLDHIGLFARDLAGMEDTLRKHEVPYLKRMAAGDQLVQVFFHDPNGVQVEVAFEAGPEGVTPDNFVPVEAEGLGV